MNYGAFSAAIFKTFAVARFHDNERKARAIIIPVYGPTGLARERLK